MSILIVPTEYATLQGAINAASSGDEIDLVPNTILYENIKIIGKEIIIKL